MFQHLCVADHCGILNQHSEQCPGQGCRGCLPRLAADGLRLCEVDTRRIGEDARTAAVLHEDLALTLIRRGRGGEKVASSSSGAPVPDDEVMEARSAIRATLASLCRMIAEERGSHLPADAIEAMGAYVAHHAVWLAAHGAAGEHARDLRDVAGDPRTRRLAYPAGTDRLYIGDCPLLVADLDGGNEGPCGTRLHVFGDSAFVLCSGCGTEETVEWWQRAIVGDAPVEVDAYSAAADLSLRHRREVTPAMLRKWAFKGAVTPLGRDGKGRTLFDLNELRGHAEKLWAPVAA
ncbi:hypothetical protein AB0I37_24975 [Micromonospora purpureochromogenes]|uniref:hypothetical protein n=1 Tax=Micromonospora purpureochromogenes TaxID=47872 RepID=UPI0033C1AE4E